MDLIKACENNDIEKALDLIMNIKQRIIKDDVLLMPLIFKLYKVQLKMNKLIRMVARLFRRHVRTV